MLLFTLIPELPLDLVFVSSSWNIPMDIPLWGWMQGGATLGGFIYLRYQNIFFTLFVGLWAMDLLEKLEQQHAGWRRWLGSALVIAVTGFAASLTRCDYGFSGILLISLLYLFRKSTISVRCLPAVPNSAVRRAAGRIRACILRPAILLQRKTASQGWSGAPSEFEIFGLYCLSLPPAALRPYSDLDQRGN